MLGVRALQLNRRGDCITCAGEREEERVALGVDFYPLVPLERVADELTMIGDQLGIVLAEPLEQTGGPLDVGETNVTVPAGSTAMAPILTAVEVKPSTTMWECRC
jgi:hypothetical protein